MTYSFDTLGYANHLKRAGVAPREAEAHAEAAREFLMDQIVTHKDLESFGRNLELSLTLRLGALMAAGIAIIGVLLAVTK